MADKNIRFKDKAGNFLYPKTKLGNIVDNSGSTVDFGKFITGDQLAEVIKGLETLAIRVVESLPLVSEASEKAIYLVPATSTDSGNLFIEYMLINGTWEVIGTAGIDLTGYVTTAALEENYYDKEDVDEKLSQVSGDISYEEVD